METAAATVPATPFNLESFPFPEPPLAHAARLSLASMAANTVLRCRKSHPIGSVVTYVNQVVLLSDNDYFSVGGHGLYFSPTPVVQC